MPNYKLILEYDGSHFHGWQVQPGLRTVQGELEAAIATLTGEKVRVNCAGRTDRGVHALGQVVNFQLQESWSPERMLVGLNGITGRDVAVIAAEVVPDSFHARFDALARQYVYQICLRPLAVGRQYRFYCKFPLDLQAMKEASQCLLGEHAFEAFSQKSPDEKHYLSRVERVEWEDHDGLLTFRIRANRFLHHMVRLIVGTLIQVGRGKLTPEEFAKILADRNRNHIGFAAPPHGLFLERVFYPDDASETGAFGTPAVL